MSERSEIYERYAAGLARRKSEPEAAPVDRAARERKLAELRRLGIKGRPELMTLYTRSLPRGCRGCLMGRGSNLVVTGLCNRSCFFCFNPQPRVDEIVVHGAKADSVRSIPGDLRRRGIRSVGISGGEPLLFPARTLDVLRTIRAELGRSVRLDLYTNGDLLTRELLARLREAGLDAIRVDLAANGYDVAPIALAREFFDEVDVELPVIPGHEARLRGVVDALDAARASHLILHELFSCAQNAESLERLGHRPKPGEDGKLLMWGPTAGSEELVLDLLAYALQSVKTLSVYYCSCSTQEYIARNSLARK